MKFFPILRVASFLSILALAFHGWTVRFHDPWLPLSEKGFIMCVIGSLIGFWASSPNETKQRRIGWAITAAIILGIVWFLGDIQMVPQR